MRRNDPVRVGGSEHADQDLRHSEQLVRLLLDTSPVMVWMAGLDKLCTFFNRPWLDFTGRTMQEELGNGWTEGVHPDDFARCLRTYETAFDARREFAMEYRLRRADGVFRWILDNGAPTYKEDGEFGGYIGSCIDITDRKETEEELRNSEARYRAFFDVNGVGASESRLLDGRFLQVNDTLCQMTGYTRDELLGMRFSDLTFLDDRDQSREDFERLARGELQSYGKDKRYVRKDGSIIWVHIEVSAVRASGGEPPYAVAIVQDITAGKRAAEALQKSNERFELATVAGLISVWEWDLKTDELVYDDYAVAHLLGFDSPEQQSGTQWLESVHPIDRPRLLAAWERLDEGQESADLVYRVFHRESGVRWQSTRCRVVEREANRVTRIIGTTTDVTELKEAEEALRESEQRYRAFFEFNAVGAGEVDLADGRFQRVNDALCQLTGYSRDELLQMRFADMTHPDDLDRDWSLFKRLVAGEIPNFGLEKRYIRKDGSIIWVQIAVTLIRDLTGHPVSEIGLTFDITDRKHAEEELEQLAARLLQLQDEERRRIARELHDETAQTLLAMNMDLTEILHRQKNLGARTRSLVGETRQRGEQLMRQIRTLSYLLHPPLLDEVGLTSALEWYVDGFRKRSGIEVELVISPERGRLPSSLETSLFRIVQESLTNLLRHSGSERASIRLERVDGRIILDVRDWGTGMSAGAIESGDGIGSLGVGIPGMRQRMRQLGGDLTIKTSRDGTIVTAVVPADGANEP
jgi:PAS domain S-box-containing protein